MRTDSSLRFCRLAGAAAVPASRGSPQGRGPGAPGKQGAQQVAEVRDTKPTQAAGEWRPS